MIYSIDTNVQIHSKSMPK